MPININILFLPYPNRIRVDLAHGGFLRISFRFARALECFKGSGDPGARAEWRPADHNHTVHQMRIFDCFICFGSLLNKYRNKPYQLLHSYSTSDKKLKSEVRDDMIFTVLHQSDYFKHNDHIIHNFSS